MTEIKSLAKSQETLESNIDARMTKLSELVPSSAEMVRLKRAFLMATAKVPKLHDCSQASLLGALVECAQLGLMPGASQEAAIIPFGQDAVFVPMYQGLLKLVYKGGLVSWVKCEVVYEKDQFEYREEAERTVFMHVPCEDDDPGELRGVYLKVKTHGEHTPLFGYMTRRDVLKHRDRSKAYSYDRNSPWHTDPEDMWRKTIVRVYAKFLPKSDDGALSRAVSLDEMADRGDQQRLEIAVPEPDEILEADGTDYSDSTKLGDPGTEPLMKHLFAEAARWLLPDEDNHAAIHDVIEPLGYASVKDVPTARVNEIKDLLRARIEDAEVTP